MLRRVLVCAGGGWGLVCVEAWGRAWCVLKGRGVVRGGAGPVCAERERGVLTQQTVFTSSVCSKLMVGSDSLSGGQSSSFLSHTVPPPVLS